MESCYRLQWFPLDVLTISHVLVSRTHPFDLLTALLVDLCVVFVQAFLSWVDPAVLHGCSLWWIPPWWTPVCSCGMCRISGLEWRRVCIFCLDFHYLCRSPSKVVMQPLSLWQGLRSPRSPPTHRILKFQDFFPPNEWTVIFHCWVLFFWSGRE